MDDEQYSSRLKHITHTMYKGAKTALTFAYANRIGRVASICAIAGATGLATTVYIHNKTNERKLDPVPCNSIHLSPLEKITKDEPYTPSVYTSLDN